MEELVQRRNVHEPVSTRIAWMDLLRGLAVVLVVFDHSADQIRSSIEGSVTAAKVFNDGVSPFRMASLMFLSGLLLPQSLLKARPVYLKGKLSKIAWPYLIWSFIILALLTATSGLTGNTVGIERFLRVFYNPPTYLWYLAYLLAFYAACLFIAPLIRSCLLPVSLVASAVVPVEDLQRMLFLFAFFLLGDLAARNRDDWESITCRKWCIAAGAMSGAITAVVAASGVSVRYEAVWAFGVLGAIVAVRPALERIAPTRVGGLLAGAGRNSIVFYVSHWSVMLVTFHLLHRGGVKNPWILLAVVLAAGLGSGFVMAWARKRWAVAAWLYQWPTTRHFSAPAARTD